MSIQSKTGSGTQVTLTGVETYGVPEVKVEFTHPTLGAVQFQSAHYGTPDKKNHGIIGSFKGQRCCVTVPRADFDAALTEARAIGAREFEALKSGAVPIQLHYSDGEYLSGHTAHGRAGQLLIRLGLAQSVAGWGTHVDRRVVDALGTSFTYAAAAELARPALEAQAAKAAEKNAARAAKFAEAARTGRRVELSSWNDDCCERDFECDLDIVTEWAMPDGTTTTSRIHTH